MNEEVIKFISTFAPTITALIAAIASIVAIVKNRKNKFGVAILGLALKLPSFIVKAEESGFNSGENKLAFVMDLSVSYLSANLNLSKERINERYSLIVNGMVEDILSTPQKKEGI